jgi:hypothetical protein
MSDWAVSEQIESEVLLGDGTHLVGALFVQGRVPQHDGPETLVEMLNRPEPFTALALTAGGVALLPKAQIALVGAGVAVGEAPADAERQSVARVIGLEVEMLGGRVLRGWATMELPPTRARALDFLNESGAFFALATETAHWVVHRAHIRGVRPLD